MSSSPVGFPLVIGQWAERTRLFTEADVQGLEQLVGPLGQAGRVPDVLIAGLFSEILAQQLPGPGTNYLKQSLSYGTPLKLRDPVRATVTITQLRPDKALVDLATRAVGPHGATIAEGRALVWVRDLPGVFGERGDQLS